MLFVRGDNMGVFVLKRGTESFKTLLFFFVYETSRLKCGLPYNHQLLHQEQKQEAVSEIWTDHFYGLPLSHLLILIFLWAQFATRRTHSSLKVDLYQ